MLYGEVNQQQQTDNSVKLATQKSKQVDRTEFQSHPRFVKQGFSLNQEVHRTLQPRYCDC